MNLFRLSWSYLRAQPLNTALNLLLLALGIGTITLILLVGHQLEDRLQRNAQGIDLVVGAKGSPMQIILANLFHLDVPTGNIPLNEAMALARDRQVAKAIPLALGDNYRGYRIVGTSHDYPAHYDITIADGQLWRRPMEAVLGAEVARQSGLQVGDHFAGTHGLSPTGGGQAHDYAPYTVVGILAPSRSVIDRLVLTSIESVWAVHEHDEHDHEHDHEHGHEDSHHHDHNDDQRHDHGQEDDHRHSHDEHHHAHDEHGHDEHEDGHHHNHEEAHQHNHDEHGDGHEDGHQHGETHGNEAAAESQHTQSGQTDRQITAVLIQYRSPIAAATLPRQINSQSQLQAAVPAVELTRLMQLLGVGIDTLRIFGLLLIVSAALGVFIALYNTLRDRQYDLAIMRSLGASRLRLMNHILLEGVILAMLGGLLGILFGHLAAELMGQAFVQARQLELSGRIWLNAEWGIVLFALLTGLAAALLPAIQAYCSDIAKILAKG